MLTLGSSEAESEIKALVQFVHFHSDNINWSTHHKKEY